MNNGKKLSRRAILSGAGVVGAAAITGGVMGMFNAEHSDAVSNQELDIGKTLDKLNQSVAERTVSVKDFGAVGDGETDDTKAIQQAMNYAHETGIGFVWIPVGTYNITSTLYMQSHCHVAGVKTSVLRCDKAIHIFSATNFEHLSIRGLKIERVNFGRAAIAMKGCSDITIKDLWIVATDPEEPVYSEGISIRECSRVLISNNHVDGTRGHCLVVGTSTQSAVGECNNVIIRDNLFENYGHTTSGMGLDVSGGWNGETIHYVKDCIVDGNVFRNGRRNGLKLQLVQNCSFTNNIVENNAELGLILNAQDRPFKEVHVTNNVFRNNGTNLHILSFTLSEAEQQVRITGNEFCDSKSAEINVEQAGGHITISNGNRFTNRLHQACVEIKKPYEDRGTLEFSHNIVETSEAVIKGQSFQTYCISNKISSVNQLLVDDRDAVKAIQVDTLVCKDNLIKGLVGTAIYIRNRDIQKLLISGNWFQSYGEGESEWTMILLSAPSSVDAAHEPSNQSIVYKSERFGSVQSVAVRIEHPLQVHAYGLVQHNLFEATPNVTQIRMIVPSAVRVQQNDLL